MRGVVESSKNLSGWLTGFSEKIDEGSVVDYLLSGFLLRKKHFFAVKKHEQIQGSIAANLRDLNK